MVFPLCFSAAMCLVDTGNGILMLLAYSWATVQPMEKLFYNFLVTALSAVVALLIGSLELVQMFVDQSDLTGCPWDTIRSIDMASLGFAIIVMFGLVFAISIGCTVCNRPNEMQCESGDVAVI